MHTYQAKVSAYLMPDNAASARALFDAVVAMVRENAVAVQANTMSGATVHVTFSAPDDDTARRILNSARAAAPGNVVSSLLREGHLVWHKISL